MSRRREVGNWEWSAGGEKMGRTFCCRQSNLGIFVLDDHR